MRQLVHLTLNGLPTELDVSRMPEHRRAYFEAAATAQRARRAELRASAARDYPAYREVVEPTTGRRRRKV